jgi:putative heme-binding domain-containing protein
MGDRKQLSGELAAGLMRLVAHEPDAEVRCQIASTARRLPARQSLPLIAALVTRDADAADPFIPLLCWFTLEGFCDTDRGDVLMMFTPQPQASPSPLEGERARVSGENTINVHSLWNSTLARQHILPRLMRRFATKATRADLLVCAQLLNAAPSGEHRQLLLSGFEEAFKGRALPQMPDELVTALAKSGHDSLLLRVRRGEIEAVRQSLTVIADTNAQRADRLLYVRTFGEVHQPDAVPVLLALARGNADVDLRKSAFAALARYDEPTIGASIAAAYANLPVALQPAAQNLLASRASWSVLLLKLVETGAVKPPNVAADVVARLRRHTDKSAAELTRKLFPISAAPLRPDTRAAVDKLQQVLKAGTGNPYVGEPIFIERCASCHQLFHKGGRIGPELTPYQRDDLSTLLPSILDPNAEIREGFVNYLVETRDGRALSGFIADQDANVVVVRGFDGEDLSLARADIREMNASGTSLMPEGLLNDLTDQQLRDFFAYLRIPQPISR